MSVSRFVKIQEIQDSRILEEETKVEETNHPRPPPPVNDETGR